MVTFRVARLEDAETLFAWRNDPMTRAMSKNQDTVAGEDHVRWLASRLARETPNLFVAFVGSDAVGTFRVDHDEVSYTVAPEHRGKGIATAMLTEVRRMFGPLRAEIYERNAASIKAASAAGHTVLVLSTA